EDTIYSTLRINSLTEFLSVSYQNGNWKYLRYRGNIYNSITQHLQSYEGIFSRNHDLANLTIFNFIDSNTTAFENWTEISDATLFGGRSKATLVRLKGQVNFIYIYNSANMMCRITNQQFSAIFSLH
ncbi:unnamed protein product, partial [Schistosoma curassoni]